MLLSILSTLFELVPLVILETHAVPWVSCLGTGGPLKEDLGGGVGLTLSTSRWSKSDICHGKVREMKRLWIDEFLKVCPQKAQSSGVCITPEALFGMAFSC